MERQKSVNSWSKRILGVFLALAMMVGMLGMLGSNAVSRGSVEVPLMNASKTSTTASKKYWAPIWHQSIANSSIGHFVSGAGRTVVYEFPAYSSGDYLKMTFSNIYGDTPYVVGGVTVYVNGKKIDVTKNKKKQFKVPTGGRTKSDKVKANIKAGSTIQVRIFMLSDYQDGNAIEEDAAVYPGDCRYLKDLPEQQKLSILEDNAVYTEVPLIEEIDVLRDTPVKTIVAFGDSITSQNRWVQPLQKRLYQKYGEEYALLNSGILGNCLTYEKPGVIWTMFGEQGTKRFQRDVLDIDNLSVVIFALGTNDFSYATGDQKEALSAKNVIAATKKIIKKLHARGVRVAVQTLSPRFGYGDYDEYMNEQRLQFNAWARSCKDIDYVFDADAVVRDPNNPNYYDDRYHQGDYLHPNAVGGKKLANAYDLVKLTGQK